LCVRYDQAVGATADMAEHKTPATRKTWLDREEASERKACAPEASMRNIQRSFGGGIFPRVQHDGTQLERWPPRSAVAGSGVGDDSTSMFTCLDTRQDLTTTYSRMSTRGAEQSGTIRSASDSAYAQSAIQLRIAYTRSRGSE
jgi:hypothetical protein